MAFQLGPHVRATLVLALLLFLFAMASPFDLPGLFGPPEFAWASWCYAFGVPVLVVALWANRPLGRQVVWPTVAYAGWIAVSAPFGADPANSFAQLAMLLGILVAALAAAWITHLHRRATAWGLGTLLLVGAVVQLLAFVHHVTVGLAERITAYAIPVGWSGYPELGLLVGLQFVILLAGLVTWRGTWGRGAASVLLVVTMVEAIFLYSRVAWVSMAAVLLALPLLSGFRRRAVFTLATAGALAAVVVAGAAALSPSFRQLGSGVVAGNFGGAGVVGGVTLNVADLSRRRDLWERSVVMIRDHWLTGVGLGNFASVFEVQYHPEVDDTGRRGPHAHNVFLHQAAELGVPGVILLGSVWAVGLGTAGLSSYRRQTFISMAVAGCVLAVLVQSMGDYFSYSLNGPRGRLTALIWMTLMAAAVAGDRGMRKPAEAVQGSVAPPAQAGV